MKYLLSELSPEIQNLLFEESTLCDGAYMEYSRCSDTSGADGVSILGN